MLMSFLTSEPDSEYVMSYLCHDVCEREIYIFFYMKCILNNLFISIFKDDYLYDYKL